MIRRMLRSEDACFRHLCVGGHLYTLKQVSNDSHCIHFVVRVLPFTNFHLCFLQDECLCLVESELSVIYLSFVVDTVIGVSSLSWDGVARVSMFVQLFGVAFGMDAVGVVQSLSFRFTYLLHLLFSMI